MPSIQGQTECMAPVKTQTTCGTKHIPPKTFWGSCQNTKQFWVRTIFKQQKQFYGQFSQVFHPCPRCLYSILQTDLLTGWSFRLSTVMCGSGKATLTCRVSLFALSDTHTQTVFSMHHELWDSFWVTMNSAFIQTSSQILESIAMGRWITEQSSYCVLEPVITLAGCPENALGFKLWGLLPAVPRGKKRI